MSDADLLRDFTENGSNSAFAAVVERHLNLVYSAARRQVPSATLAEEVTQSVFLELARNAHRIKPGTPLVAWLHVVSRRIAINTVRGELRRQAREQAAMEIETMKPNPPLWTELEPLLDEVVEKLNETDRAAILLRYFQNKSMREVGEALGASEEAAQKRVTRAVDRLRTLFLKRGLAVGSAGLVTDLSAHAVQSAPAALGASISTSTLASSVALLKTTEAIAMTTMQKSLIAAGLALALGGGLYGVRESVGLRAEISRQEQLSANLRADAEALGRERDADARKAAAADAEIDRLLARAKSPEEAADQAMTAEMKAWLARLERLKQLGNERPQLTIPELRLLDEQTWFLFAQSAKFETDSQIQDTFARLRSSAQNALANKMAPALKAYLKENSGTLPAEPIQLAPYFDPPIDPSLLLRYRMLQTGKYADVPRGETNAIIAVSSVIDLDRDTVWRIGPNGFSSDNAMGYNVKQARKEFAKANPDQKAPTAAELSPYLPWPADAAAVEKILGRAPAGKQP